MQQYTRFGFYWLLALGGGMGLILWGSSCLQSGQNVAESTPEVRFDTSLLMTLADAYLAKPPLTITAFPAPRSAGGRHDYYSEGRYWWPNPDDLDGPYIRKDGQSNPDNFNAHKQVLRNFAEVVATLTAAYQLTGDERYASHALEHLRAWLVAADTRMNPSLLYGQAIKGVTTGRGIGIIDTLCLIDVARSILLLVQAGQLPDQDLLPIRQWFSDYGDWLTTHPHGLEERDNNNNHSTWWGAQLAAYARVAERSDLLQLSQTQFKKQLDIQMAADGSFPHELERTKPWHYTLYTLNAWTALAELASTPQLKLWAYKARHGSLSKAIEFVVPYLQEPASWPYATELEPEAKATRQDFLLHAAYALDRPDYLQLWQALPAWEEDANPAALLLWLQNRLN
ncbi:MAG: hypothetical protein D6772_11440 [Bacteroidetes bacterium]|nr:MAG: hypothetical protein D6772_11440 [Bacteroidota bacterium]